MGIFKKSCGLCPPNYASGTPKITIYPQVNVTIPASIAPMPAPNPARFKILRSRQVGQDCVVAKVHYPDCTNYEGNKIILYVGLTELDVSAMTTLDPHFSESGISPFARFEPTESGWNWAIDLAERMCDR